MSDTINLTALPTLDKLGRDRLKTMIHGEPGTGKTTLATSIAEKFKTLYVYFPGEQGVNSIPASYRKNITPYLVKGVEEANDILWQLQLGDHPFDAVVLESASALQNMYARYVQNLPQSGPRTKEQMAEQQEKKKKKGAKKTDMRNVGGEVGSHLKDDFTFWYSLADATAVKPIHVVMTSQSRRREIREKTADQNTLGALIDEYVGPDVFPGCANTVEATPDYIGYTFIEEAKSNSLESLAGDAEPEWRYCVRFGPHDLIRTKLREDVEASKHWPAVVGRDGKRLTLPKFCKFLGIS